VPCPDTVGKALVIAEQCMIPTSICVREGGKYPEIVSYKGWKPPPQEHKMSDNIEDDNNVLHQN